MQGFINDYPLLAYELANELARRGRQSIAVHYYRELRRLPGDADPAVLLQLGRCHLALGEQPNAEECFLEAIDADEDSIEARIELANMYENAREGEEALIFAAEAMALCEARGQASPDDRGFNNSSAASQRAKLGGGPARRRKPRAQADVKPSISSKDASKKPVVPRRYRPKRLAAPDKRLQEEKARAFKLSSQYEAVRNLKQQIAGGRHDLVPVWMATSKELVDDFRSLKRFYTWDKYLYFLGSKHHAPAPGAEQEGSELSQMYERLSRSQFVSRWRLSRGSLLTLRRSDCSSCRSTRARGCIGGFECASRNLVRRLAGPVPRLRRRAGCCASTGRGLSDLPSCKGLDCLSVH